MASNKSQSEKPETTEEQPQIVTEAEKIVVESAAEGRSLKDKLLSKATKKNVSIVLGGVAALATLTAVTSVMISKKKQSSVTGITNEQLSQVVEVETPEA